MNLPQTKNDEWVHQVSMPQTAKERFIALVSNLDFNPYELLAGTEQGQSNTALYAKVAQLLEEAWPEARQTLGLIEDKDSPVHLVVIKNAPVDTNLNDIPTPNNGVRPSSKSFVTEYMMVAVAGLINGYLRAPSTETFPFNLPIHQVAPQEGFEAEEATNRGVGNFPFHNDRVFIEHELIDYHMLYGLRTGANPTTTNFLRVADLLKGMDTKLLHPLLEKNYKNPNSEVRVAALHGKLDDLEHITSSVDLHEGWMQPVSVEAEQALAQLKQQAVRTDVASQAVNILLEEGTIVLSNHKKLLHGRGSFKAGNIGERRWLQRAHLCKAN